MSPERRAELAAGFLRDLLEDTLPFWLGHAPDAEHGGFLTCLDRDGALLDSDKPIWVQGRFTWLLATLYNTLEKRDEWLAQALSGLEFLELHGFDRDGRMFFLVTREGRPLRKRRYVYSELFACLAYAACARATGRQDLADRARKLYALFLEASFTPGRLPPKVDPATRSSRSLGPLMFAIHGAQVLRETIGLDGADERIDSSIAEIELNFVRPDLEVVLEQVGPDGEILDHFDGRTLNPGHAIEAAWFILHESRARGGDAHLTGLGTRMLDWMWLRGWDRQHGGLFSLRDLHDGPVAEYWHDMKFWWPHNEAILATLLAHDLTGNARYAAMFSRVHDYCETHFRDRQHGEWFGYLHRDGSVSSYLKGNHWKGPYHVPRMQWYAARLLAGSD